MKCEKCSNEFSGAYCPTCGWIAPISFDLYLNDIHVNQENTFASKIKEIADICTSSVKLIIFAVIVCVLFTAFADGAKPKNYDPIFDQVENISELSSGDHESYKEFISSLRTYNVLRVFQIIFIICTAIIIVGYLANKKPWKIPVGERLDALWKNSTQSISAGSILLAGSLLCILIMLFISSRGAFNQFSGLIKSDLTPEIVESSRYELYQTLHITYNTLLVLSILSAALGFSALGGYFIQKKPWKLIHWNVQWSLKTAIIFASITLIVGIAGIILTQNGSSVEKRVYSDPLYVYTNNLPPDGEENLSVAKGLMLSGTVLIILSIPSAIISLIAFYKQYRVKYSANPNYFAPHLKLPIYTSVQPSLAPSDFSESASAKPSNNVAASLKELEELKAIGLISEDEYLQKRKEILGRL